MKIILAPLLAICMSTVYAQEKTDTTLMQEVTVSSAKDNRALREQPLAATTIDTHLLKSKQISSMKDFASLVPGLYIP